MSFFTEMEQIILHLYKPQKTLSSRSNLEREEQCWRYHTPWFQTILWSYNNQNYMALAQKQTHRYQWNRTDSPEISLFLYVQLVCDRGTKNIQWGEHSVSNKWCFENWTATWQQVSSKLFKNINVKSETIKLLEKNIGNMYFGISHNDNFFGFVSSGKGNKSKSN